MTPEAQREIEKNKALLELLKAGGETAFSTIGNAFFDLGSWGATAVANPWKAAQGFGNEAVADEFANLNRERRSQLPELGVTPSTEKIQEAFMSPIKETASNVWNKAQEAAPNATESLVDYFTDPRVMHTLQAAGFAAPAIARVGAGVRGANMLDNLKGNRAGVPNKAGNVSYKEIEDALQIPNNQKGMIQLLSGETYGEENPWLKNIVTAIGGTASGDYSPYKRFDPRFDDRVREQAKLHALDAKFDRPPPEVPEASIFDYEGYPIITSMSDRLRAQGNMTSINGVELDRPVPTFGGQDHMFMPENIEKGQVWSSAENPVKQIIDLAQQMKMLTGKDPLYAPWRMSPSGGDFSTTTGETMLSYAHSNMGIPEKKLLDKELKAYVTKGKKDPDTGELKGAGLKMKGWKGVDSPDAAEIWRKQPDRLRKELKQMMNVKFRNKGGLGKGEARLAVADPQQFYSPDAYLQNIGQIHPDRGMIMESGHPSYPRGVAGEGIGRLKENINMFQIMDALVKERKMGKRIFNPSARDKRAAMMKPYANILTEDILRSLQGQ